ncbi:hypothetical protein [Aerophototrophica crusticola]
MAEGFLSHCLGGAYQPVGEDFAGATLEVQEGASYVPGLNQALSAKK